MYIKLNQSADWERLLCKHIMYALIVHIEVIIKKLSDTMHLTSFFEKQELKCLNETKLYINQDVK